MANETILSVSSVSVQFNAKITCTIFTCLATKSTKKECLALNISRGDTLVTMVVL